MRPQASGVIRCLGRPVPWCAALMVGFLVGCDCCHKKHDNDTDWGAVAAAAQERGGGGPLGSGGGGGTGGGGSGGGGGGPGGHGGGVVPEISPSAAAGALTLLGGLTLILVDRRYRLTPCLYA
jgi:hypothetical protein